jgi:ABC-type branched-subunit amino acid transport system ATPase component
MEEKSKRLVLKNIRVLDLSRFMAQSVCGTLLPDVRTEFAKKALQISDIGYVLNLGKVVMEGPSRTLLENDNLLKGYLLA